MAVPARRYSSSANNNEIIEGVPALAENSQVEWTLEKIVEYWQELQAIQEFINVINTTPGALTGKVTIAQIEVGNDVVSLEDYFTFGWYYITRFIPLLNEDKRYQQAVGNTTELGKKFSKNIELVNKLPQELSTTAQLIITINDLVKLVFELPDVDEVVAFKRRPNKQEEQAAGVSDAAQEAVVPPILPEDPASAKVVIPPLPPEEEVRELAPTRRPYQILSIHNAFARNEVAHNLLHLYGYSLREGNPFEVLSPNAKFLIDRELRAYLLQLNTTQLEQLNRQAFVESFFKNFVSSHPEILAPDIGLSPEAWGKLSIAEQTAPTPVAAEASQSETTTLTTATEPGSPSAAATLATPVAGEVAAPERSLGQTGLATPQITFDLLPLSADDREIAESAYTEIQRLGKNGFFERDLQEVQTELRQVLQRYGVAPHETDSILRFVHFVPAVGEDASLVLFGADRTEITTLFPQLANLDDNQLSQVLEELAFYTERTESVAYRITERPRVFEKIGELPSPEIIDKTLEVAPRKVGSLKDVSTFSTRMNRVTSAATSLEQSSPSSEKVNNGFQLLVANNTSATELEPYGQQSRIIERYRRWLGSTYGSRTDQAIGQVRTLQGTIMDSVLTAVGQERADTFVVQLQQLSDQYDVFVDKSINRLGLDRFKDNPFVKKYLLGQEKVLNFLERITPNELVDTYHSLIGKNANPLTLAEHQGNLQNWLKQFWGLKKAQQAAATVETVNRAQLLSKALLSLGEAAKKAQSLFNISRILIAIKALLATLMAALGPILGGLVALGGALLGAGALSSLFSNASAAGADLAAKGAQSLTTGLNPASAQGATNASLGFGQNAAQVGSGGTGSGAGASLLDKATSAAKDFIAPTTTTGLASLTVVSTGAVIVVTSALSSAFFKPLNIMGEESPYVDMEKVAVVGDNIVRSIEELTADTDVTYQITIKPKDGYTLNITSLEDEWSVRFNEEKLDELNQAVPKIDPVTRLYKVEGDPKHADFQDDITLDEGGVLELKPDETLVLKYTTKLTRNMMHSSVNNSFTLGFEFSKEGEAPGTDQASIDNTICVGECPQIGQGCWPLDGTLTQLPFDIPKIANGPGSHAPGEITPKGLDAFDIGVAIGTPVVAPYSGRLCGRPYDSEGYGTWVVLDQIGGEDFELHFAHLSGTIFGGSSSACRDVSAGEIIGYSGNSGNSSGPHLHYGLVPVTYTGTPVSRLREYVPPSDTLFDTNSSGNSTSIGKKLSEFGPVCQANGSSD